MNYLVLEKNIYIPKERAYPEYHFKSILTGHAFVNIEKITL